MNQPSIAKLIVAALAASIAAVLARVLGGLVLNQSLNTEQVLYLLTDSWVLPKFFAWTAAISFAVGVPLMKWAHRKDVASLWFFVVVGIVAGYLSSYPLLLIPSWAVLHSLSGLLGALAAFGVLATSKGGTATGQ
jgi:hypothetical protein